MLQETELHPHSFSVSSIQDLAGPGKGTFPALRLEIKGYPHLCIRNTTEAQTPTLIGTAAEGESCFGVPEVA
jgi:hypothetical protein